jgi:hypothetical protein
MRIKSADDVKHLGASAKKQIEAVLKQQGGFNNQKRASSINEFGSPRKHAQETVSATTPNPAVPQKKQKPARIMKTHDNLTYCPWPSTDPFVEVHKQLERKFGMFSKGGMLLNEMIIHGGEKDWRFDLVLLSPCQEATITHTEGTITPQLSGPVFLAIESDGYGPHRSKDAFKNDRKKQSHALTQGFVVMRITTEDVRLRLDKIMSDIDTMLGHQRIYDSGFTITPKGRTQCVFNWNKTKRKRELT